MLFGGIALYFTLGLSLGWVKITSPPTVSPEELAQGWALVTAGGVLFAASGVALMLGKKWPILLMGIGAVAFASVAFYHEHWFQAFQGVFLGILDIAKGLRGKSAKTAGPLAEAMSFKNPAEFDEHLERKRRLRLP